MNIYDCVIVGGGPAGLSAGIYMGRYNRSTLIVDNGHGRSSYDELNENYLGFPNGIPSRELRRLGKLQAQRFGVDYSNDLVLSITLKDNTFQVVGEKNVYHSRTIILATGVQDIFPEFKHFQDYIGHSLFWCITCDGHKTIGKKVAVVGNDDDAAITTLQFLNFTNKLLFITNCPIEQCKISDGIQNTLEKAGIPIYKSPITSVVGENGMMQTILLANGDRVPTDYMFSQQGAIPKNDLAKQLGVKIGSNGYILVDLEQRTNIPFVYAAGDITKPFSHQIVAAAYEGAAAAESANYDLYTPEQKG